MHAYLNYGNTAWTSTYKTKLKKVQSKQKQALRIIFSGGSRTAATSKMERFMIIVNGFQPLAIITKRSILDFAAALDLPLIFNQSKTSQSEPIFLSLIILNVY